MEEISTAYNSGRSTINLAAGIPDDRRGELTEGFAKSAKEHTEPMEILMRKVLRNADRQRFEKDLNELKGKIASQTEIVELRKLAG